MTDVDETHAPAAAKSGIDRRSLMKAGVFAGAAVALPAIRSVSAALPNQMAASKLPKPFTLPFRQAPIAKMYRQDATRDNYLMSMQARQVEIIPGFKTWVFGYSSLGDGTRNDFSVPGPTIKATQGRPATVRFINDLPAKHPTLQYSPWTSVHLHGSASLPQFDGYASDITVPKGGVRPDGTICTTGEYKDYDYPNYQVARTLWYHDHGVHHTAENAYHGLLGQYHLSDAREQALGIPQGEFDVALTIGDAMFQADGNLLWSLANANGHWGDVILVNGVPWPKMQVKRRKYRFRMLTAAISRSFEFSLSTNDTFHIIGCDGGLAPAPVGVKKYRQLSGERYEIIVDFSKYPVGTKIDLRNSMAGINVAYANTNKVMQFEVIGDAFDPANNSLPATLNPDGDIMKLTTADVAGPLRQIRLERTGGVWMVNGKTWDMIEKGIHEEFDLVEFMDQAPIKAGTVEEWEITNKSGGWYHPLHIHLVDFKVISRNGLPALPHECGPKDVVFMGENETVRLLAKYPADSAGKYMVHCHNLVHEDHDMMTQFEVFNDDLPGLNTLNHPMGTKAVPTDITVTSTL